jgi:hypothetical protein
VSHASARLEGQTLRQNETGGKGEVTAYICRRSFFLFTYFICIFNLFGRFAEAATSFFISDMRSESWRVLGKKHA